MDSVFGAYHYLKGDPVRIGFDVPDMFAHEKLATRGITAAGIIKDAIINALMLNADAVWEYEKQKVLQRKRQEAMKHATS